MLLFQFLCQFLYKVISSLVLVCILPLLPLMARRIGGGNHLAQRLGRGLGARLNHPGRTAGHGPTIWIHALSVGEVTSALPLVRSLRHHLPQARLVFSATTRSGSQVAAELLPGLVESLIAAPLDLGPVVPWYLNAIRPDLFIVVETDFWPHWLWCLHQRRIPLVLVNGRISAHSFVWYHRLAFFFRPMFAMFTLLSMQTENDACKMRELGLAPTRVVTLGNLKFDTRATSVQSPDPGTREAMRQGYGFSATGPLWICGSTHPGEEEQILRIYEEIRCRFSGLQLLIAPRNIERTKEICVLAAGLGFPCRCRSTDKEIPGPLLVLDTIGELAGCYAMADVVFVGGSLAPFGGHNPLEPAAAGVAVLFGPHMEDCVEIAEELVHFGGAVQVENAAMLARLVAQLLADPEKRRTMGAKAASCVAAHRGVADTHARMLAQLLAKERLQT